MSSIILTPQKAEKLKVPTPAESAAIARVSSNRHTSESFQNQFEARFKEIDGDFDHIPSVMREAFTSLNGVTENYLARNIEGFQGWSLLSRQPRILARSASQDNPLGKLIGDVFAKTQVVRNSNKRSIVTEFLCEAFWNEVGAVIHSEIAKTPFETYSDLLALSDDGETDYVSSYSEDFNGRRKDELWAKYKDKFKFLTYISRQQPSLIGVLIREGFEKQFDRALKAGSEEEIEECFAFDTDGSFIADIVEHRRLQKRATIKKTIEKFRDLWQRRTSVVLPDNLPISARTPNEQSIFSDLVTDDLNDVSTDKNPAYLTQLDASSPFVERLNELDRFTRQHPGMPISPLVTMLFPNSASELSPLIANRESSVAAPLPTRAPKGWPKWKTHREGNESALEFATRIYGQWMQAGVIIRTDLRAIDEDLYRGINTWFRNHPDKAVPPGYNLPTEPERNASWAQRVVTGEIEAPKDLAGARKLANHLGRAKKPGRE